MKKRILLLSAYDIASHRYWREGLVETLPNIDWTVLTLPPRHFSWRIRSNSMSWAFSHQETLEKDYDLLVATSMTDLSALRGFLPKLSEIPNIVYCHENQFAFPQTEAQFKSVEPQLLNIYTLLAADVVLFNSHFNLETFLEGARTLLKKFPDYVPPNIVELIETKSTILPVPLSNLDEYKSNNKNKTFSIVWNHRWEYDKGPSLLLSIVKKLCESHMEFKFHLIGQQFRNSPKEFSEIIDLLKNNDSLGKEGFIENKDDYYQCLSSSHIVLSTSQQEFQGLSIMEACELGCTPVLPNRLSYPEFFDQKTLYKPAPSQESELAFQMLTQRYKEWENGSLKSNPKNLPLWKNLKAEYENILNAHLMK